MRQQETLFTHHDNELRSLFLTYLEHSNRHDFDRMTSFYAPIVEVNGTPRESAAIAKGFTGIFSAFPDWNWEVRGLVVEGDYIAVHYKVTGTHLGIYENTEATNRRVAIPEFTLYRFGGGKITHIWDHTDMAAVMGQLTDDAEDR